MRSDWGARHARGWLLPLAAIALIATACGGDEDDNTPEQDEEVEPTDDRKAATCGNGVVETGEECDDGNTASGDACTNECTWTCVAGDPKRDNCSDGDACNGVETCTADHVCAAGTPLAEGASCGEGRVCLQGSCATAACGDGAVQGAEECDDGNAESGDGCEPDCKFTCIPGTRETCDDGEACNGEERCGEGNRCVAGTPVADDATCATVAKGYCASGVCVGAICGNAKKEPGEDCDDANENEADGCKKDCTYTCTRANECDDGNPCTADACDTASTNACTNVPDATKNGDACNANGVAGFCSAGACRPATCGDGIVDTASGEQCDLGTANGTPGSGCRADCRFECGTDANCSDGNACNGTETCVAVEGGRTCRAGTAIAEGGACADGPRRICRAGNCVTTTCGDGFVDQGGGEQCDPPNGTTCDAQCKRIVCGDGVVGGTEQCDDGNTRSLDGCDSQCRFEPVLRMSSLSISTAQAPEGCTPRTNALGRNVLTGTALGQINPPLRDSLNDGGTNILLQLLDLDDLTGANDPNFQIGIMTGTVDPAKPWPTQANADKTDFWFQVDPLTLDANGLPLSRIDAAVAGRAITGGPNGINFVLNLLGRPATLAMRDARVTARTEGTADVPPTPAQLRANLNVLRAMRADAAGQGLCGNITVESFASIPAPDVLTTGTFACAQCNTGSRRYRGCGEGQPVGPNCNSLLDIMVGGCRVGCLITAVNATQPDVRGGNGPTTLTLGADGKVPEAQWRGNTNAYSAYMQFFAQRARITGRQPAN
jgi:cysteine-rich repeat protein